jgi:hypothetical protein
MNVKGGTIIFGGQLEGTGRSRREGDEGNVIDAHYMHV